MPTYLYLQATSNIGSQFIFIHYNETQQEENDTVASPSGRIQGYLFTLVVSYVTWMHTIDKVIQTFYRHGPKDAINVIFYSVLWIIIHAVVHEYIWEV